jgi:hypothetical protein
MLIVDAGDPAAGAPEPVSAAVFSPVPSAAQPAMPLATATDWDSRRHVQSLLLMGATVLGLYLCFRFAQPFLPALAWAL